MEILIKIFVYSWIISVFYGIIVAIANPIFKDETEDAYEVYIPLYNLFGLCSFNNYDEKYGLLFLVPFVNLLFMRLMSFKIKDRYSLDSLFSAGLLLVPAIFVPLLAYSNKGKDDKDSYTYKSENEEPEVKIQKVNIKGKKNSEEEVFEQEPLNDDDSIFKIQSKTQGNANNKPYRAKKVKVNEQFINSAPAEREKIEKVEKGDN